MLGQQSGLFHVGVRHQHAEFLATQTQQGVAVAAEHFAHALAEGAQAGIAHAVAVLVVDPLEEVDVHQQQRQLAAMALGTGAHGREQVVELVAVAQLGQAVGAAQGVQALALLQQLQFQLDHGAVFAMAAVERQQQVAEVEHQGDQLGAGAPRIEAQGYQARHVEQQDGQCRAAPAHGEVEGHRRAEGDGGQGADQAGGLEGGRHQYPGVGQAPTQG
ncbi:hypothetical protein D9M68_607270 [compost metagenome]